MFFEKKFKKVCLILAISFRKSCVDYYSEWLSLRHLHVILMSITVCERICLIWEGFLAIWEEENFGKHRFLRVLHLGWVYLCNLIVTGFVWDSDLLISHVLHERHSQWNAPIPLPVYEHLIISVRLIRYVLSDFPLLVILKHRGVT